ncbi:DUF4148 domain-containing protein [Paraburkholderia sp. B3]|uniref:DUF4148 domain-containing protein n=1 Tax=Paraburkholderia sp. B3 TaxID=3134791 RepID=UPI0039826C7D
MKTLMIIAALAGLATTTSAFAQSANAGTPLAQPAAATQVAANATAQPYGQPVAQKTRAQVYQELVQAEQDGQLAYLNSTVYAH